MATSHQLPLGMAPNGQHIPMMPDHIQMQRFQPTMQQLYQPVPGCNLQRDIARAVELITKLQNKERTPDDKLQKLKEV